MFKLFHMKMRIVDLLGCQWLILLGKIRLFSNLVKPASKSFYNFKDSKCVLIFSPALVAVELLTNLLLFT
jgi:hypothetical protein